MKAYEIDDEELKLTIGVLLYYGGEDSFIIELEDGLDEGTAPLMFASFVRNKTYTIPRDVSRKWVLERVIPNSRQNLSYLVKKDRLKPLREEVKGNLFLKGDVIRNK